MRRILLGVAAITGFAIAGAAQAQTATGNLTVSASVPESCSVNSPTLSFGSITDLSVATNATATLNVTCTFGLAYTVGLDNGANYASSTRNMIDSGHLLAYELHRTSAAGPNWGDAVVGDRESGTGNGGSADSFTIYGVVPAQINSGWAGTAYTDTVGITVYF